MTGPTIPLEADVLARAEDNAAAIRQRAGPQIDRLEARVTKILMSVAPTYRKHLQLAALADEAAALVAPNTPCKKGCADCCYQAVPIPLHQAQLLSAVTGRRLNAAAGRLIDEQTIQIAQDRAESMLANPQPCPFLVDNACSVYDARPITCRTHHVLHADSSRCNLFHGKRLAQAKFDLSWIDGAAADIGMLDRWADIRDFFPAP